MQTGVDVEINDVAVWDAGELLAAFAAARLSPLQALQGITERIARKNPEINAFACLNPQALDAARESTARWREGSARALEGVPVTVSERLDVAGLPSRRGAARLADAPVVARLREAGAVILGKTISISPDEDTVYGIPRNPWDVACTPGSGAGAAAAAFFGPFHVLAEPGERGFISAAWSGVVGFGVGAEWVLTRSVQDAALLAACLAGRPAFTGLETGIERVKIGVWRHVSCVALEMARSFLAGQDAFLTDLQHMDDPAFDIVLRPAVSQFAPPAASEISGARFWQSHLPKLRQMVITLPVGVTPQGLPLAVCLSAHAEQEALLLRVARRLERSVNEV